MPPTHMTVDELNGLATLLLNPVNERLGEIANRQTALQASFDTFRQSNESQAHECQLRIGGEIGGVKKEVEAAHRRSDILQKDVEEIKRSLKGAAVTKSRVNLMWAIGIFVIGSGVPLLIKFIEKHI